MTVKCAAVLYCISITLVCCLILYIRQIQIEKFDERIAEYNSKLQTLYVENDKLKDEMQKYTELEIDLTNEIKKLSKTNNELKTFYEDMKQAGNEIIRIYGR